MNKPIYLDHGATSYPKAPGCSEAMVDFMKNSAGNPGRGGHHWTLAASRSIEAAREDIAALLGGDPERTLLGPGATFWLNTIFNSSLHAKSRVLLSRLEHNAVMRPLRELERQRGIELAFLEGHLETGIPSIAEILEATANFRSDLIVLTHASNVSGAVLPVEEIAAAVAPVPVIVDGAQSAGVVPFDFDRSEIAAFICSGHKGLLGPPGTGAMLLSPDFSPEPLIRGGTGSRSESEEMPAFLPDRLEAGTPNGPGIAGLGASCRWLAQQEIERVAQHESELVHDLASALEDLPGVHLPGYDRNQPHTGVLSFVISGLDTGEMARWLDQERGIALRAGLHCAPAAHRRLGSFPHGTLRAGIGVFTTRGDIDRLIESVEIAVTQGIS